MYDVAVVGAGVAGWAPAARFQARGLSTSVFEARGWPGGCAGFFRRRGFAFDVGATTLVDFQPAPSPAAIAYRLHPAGAPVRCPWVCRGPSGRRTRPGHVVPLLGRASAGRAGAGRYYRTH
jgi:phytoene dehydrogenase-like protein